MHADYDEALKGAERAVSLFRLAGHEYGAFMATRERLRAWWVSICKLDQIVAAPFDEMSLYLQTHARNHMPGMLGVR